MALAWCPYCFELVPCYDNGKNKYDPRTKRQRFVTHPNKDPKRSEPDCLGSGTDI